MMVPSVHQWLRWGVVMLVAGVLTAGCLAGDECEAAEVACDGNVALTCQSANESSRRNTWSREDCGAKVCVTGTGAYGATAFCALSANPDARCSGGNEPACAGAALVQCTAGHATAERTCTASCLTLDDYPDRCSDDPATDSACMPAGTDSCVFVMTGNSSFTVQGAPVPTPSGSCTEGGMSAPAGSVIYSQRCQGGAIVARTRCAQGCVSHADCTTSCQ